ncbi:MULTISPECIES: IpaD/SipD/SspD family type III secretion system needle tip protein [Proteus]|uniref:IpaD/SipD/SspD family type III secretion system needle tip protein n=1 Tax=Proteus columbae TaxID=1987580 RepID=A0A6I7D894_9GAMM|nr:IpaD/SipD/SspD family type III secretion system needle tip protein [Proteus columbae]MBG2802458.1 IpaD/SipD/SspD family type III secretion system needle tip protein [Proteus mirabilis]MBG3151079.1 IpaD/SipD/SspD family type III secretion system needle tip protein [Proteus mirabilis]QHN12016.1 IpaD/SipD/SspD family type III secretion system needle tip protein [Proteus columbae]
MATAINFDVPKSNHKPHVENKFYNVQTHNQDEFLNNSSFLLEDIKREYQDLYINDSKYDNKFEYLSSKEKGFYLDEQYVKNNINQKKSLNEISYASRAIENAQSNDSYPTDSLSDLFDEVKQSIIAGKNDYLDVLKDIFSKYMDFVRELREILSELSRSTNASGKDGFISVFPVNITNKLIGFMRNLKSSFFSMEFFKDNDGRFYRMIDGEKIYYKDEAEVNNAVKAVRKLLSQIKGVSLVKESNTNMNFSFEIKFDVSGIKKLKEHLFNMPNGWSDILQTEFELLKKTFDTVEKGVNTNLDELSKKYSAANSNYDNFVKIVSSTMNALLEMAKGFLRF